MVRAQSMSNACGVSRLAVLLLTLALPGCSTRPAPGGESASSTSATSASVPSTTAEGSVPPPLGTLKRIALSQGQGGPSLTRCNGVVWELALELPSGQWTYGSCPSCGRQDKQPRPDEPLQEKRGTLDATQRAAFDAAYGRLRIGPARGCGADGGTLRLTVTKTDGTGESWVDQNWGCRKPPPLVATGIRDLAQILSNAAVR
jgi:hypothetical protein